MNPTVNKSWELAQKLGLTIHTTSKHIGISGNTYTKWVRDGSNPTKNSLKKVQRFIDRVEAGETFKPKEKKKPKGVSIDNLQQGVQVMYELIYKLEDKYGGSLSNVPEDDPVLRILRKEVGVI